MLHINSYLRDSVQVRNVPSGVELRFSVWSITLPYSLVNSSDNLSDFLNRKKPSSSLSEESNEIKNLIFILDAQGCLIPEKTKDSYKLTDIKPLYISFCNEFYGYYYAHPLWTVMRQSNISLSTIQQWVSRTYFLSKFAGVTASAATINSPTQKVRDAFLKSTIEEYSHCEDYYYPPEELFENTEYSNGIAPNASFIAFDQQMLYIAKNDWLAHLFIALFQERTAKFKSGAYQLYSRIEQQLRMPGLFNGWRIHISFDEDNSHETDLDTLFIQDLEISLADLNRSFNEASLTIEILIDGLEDVFYLGEQQVNPRAKLKCKSINYSHFRGLRCFSKNDNFTLKSNNLVELAEEFTELIFNNHQGKEFLSSSSSFMSNALEKIFIPIFLETLGSCVKHDEIIAIGSIIEVATKNGLKNMAIPDATNKSERIIWNFLFSQTDFPSNISFLILIFLKLVSYNNKFIIETKNILDISILTSISHAVNSIKPSASLIEASNLAFSLTNMLEYTYSKKTSADRIKKFKIGHNN